MFSVGETVIYGAQGVCKIKDISCMQFGNEKREYYILNPIYEEKATIYVPADNEKLLSHMRSIITADDIDKLIKSASKDELEWIEDDAKRKEFCEEVIKKGNRKELMLLIEMLYLHWEELKTQKKHFHIADERYLKEAEKLLHDEFAYVLGITRDEVPEYIMSKIRDKK